MTLISNSQKVIYYQNGQKITAKEYHPIIKIKPIIIDTNTYNKSFGTMGGFGSNFVDKVFNDKPSFNTGSYGLWADFGKYGVQYLISGSINMSMQDAMKFVNNTNKLYEAGSLNHNISFYRNYINKDDKRLITFIGIGITISEQYNVVTKNIPYNYYDAFTRKTYTNYQEISTVEKVNNVYPNFIGGFNYQLNPYIIGRGEILLGKTSCISFGLGFKID